MRSFLKFRLLLWKNFLIQKRKPILTCFEIGLPTLFSLILMVLRLRVDSTPHSDVTTWIPCDYSYIPKNLLGRTLGYAPQNEVTDRMMARVTAMTKVKTQAFPSEEAFVAAATNASSAVKHEFLGGAVFQNSFSQVNRTMTLTKKVDYKLRFNYSPVDSSSTATGIRGDSSWSTRFMFPVYQIVGPREKSSICNWNPGYQRAGFLAVQHAVDDAIMHEVLSGEALKEYTETVVKLRRQPYPPYIEDNFVLVLQQQFPLVIMLSLVVIVLGIVRDVVLEKERRLKESMKMMGINNWLHWVAWFTKHCLFLLISVAVMTLFFCVELDSAKGAVVANTNPFIVFLFLVCFSLATITFCFAVSVFFKKANTGAAVGGILFFCMYIPYFFLQKRYETLSLSDKLVACLDFQVAMAFGGNLLGQFEGTGSGIQFSNLTSGVSVDDDFSMVLVLAMLLLDSVLHCLVAWYVEAVFPGEYGTPQPWYFPVLPSYWGCLQKHEDYVDIDGAVSVGQDPSMFEKEPNDPAGIQIRNLRKVYGKGTSKKVAVAGMTLNMYEGQITALLGHNGAGKTTTMSMLTGFYPPSSGTAIISGYDIRHSISEVRSSLGLCPQHDILFDNLTVEEHVIFFGLLKGVPKAEVIPQCEEMLKDMELFPKLKARAKTLSGGMKRKLSVCIALIGNSKVVFLDEPSSGLDPNARRNIWTVLQKNRAGRTMVLSTHFMEEADLLGDRIAIMSNGVVKCCGSSLFLKKKYGAGYHMVVVKESSCDVSKVISVVKSHVEPAEVESNVGAELSFVLPQDYVGRFEGLFQELENRQRELGISSFGASVTTMEEVFLKVGESDDEEVKERLHTGINKTVINRPASSSSGDSGLDSQPLLRTSGDGYGSMSNGNSVPPVAVTQPSNRNGAAPIFFDLRDEDVNWSPQILNLSKRLSKNHRVSLFAQQFWAMLLKRVLHTLRNKLITVTQLVVPLFFTVMGIIVLKTMPSFIDMPPLPLTADQYGSNFVPYSSVKDWSKLAQVYGSLFRNQPDTHPINVDDTPGYKDDPSVVKFLIDQGEANVAAYNLRYQVAAEFNKSAQKRSVVTAYYNNQGFHSIAISFAAMYDGLIKYYTNSSEYEILTTNDPLPRLSSDKARDQKSLRDPSAFMFGFNVGFGMAFLASSFVLFLVKERATKAKHIQFVSGVYPANFWLSTVCWDLVNYIIPCIVIVICFFIFSIEPYTEDLHWLDILLMFFLYGWSMLPYMYLFSFAFTVPSTAYVWITMFNILTGVTTMLVVVILSIPQIGLEDVSVILEWTFMVLFPNFSLAQSLYEFYENHQALAICTPEYSSAEFCKFSQFMNISNPCCPGICGEFCLTFNRDYLGWEKGGIGRFLFFLTVQGMCLWVLIFSFEYGWLKKLWYKMTGSERTEVPPPGAVFTSQLSRDSVVQEDEDVARERGRIDNMDRQAIVRSEKLVLNNLTKYYGQFRAVDHLSVGIPPGECFGLLGINGAGKTSTFMMLTGDSSISSGQAYLDSYNLKTETEMARKRLGYCPQFDALIDQLTGRETLTLFARLRGVVEKEIPEAVENMMAALTLTQYADKQCQTYSGGNKRKLSTAIALIGDPDVVFLDEPTTGMDPMARRMLWEVLSMVRDSGRTLVLTSHSMEECEALCTRLAIMVNGQFKCLGSIQHLKNKFGEGYTFTAKVAIPEEHDGAAGLPNLGPLREFMEQTFPHSTLTDVHENMVNYHIRDTSLSWAQVFGEMERAKEKLGIEDYLVSQTSLEQVFIYFARMQNSQENATGSSNGFCRSFCCCLPCCHGGDESIASAPRYRKISE
ncbi:ATP-binding cassette sub-family A member 3 [Aplysia californica]|uniref:ATP-binding cassette sub-family A member 3 n=1 Tax=Aplysia californica TaxID=6500 RepID=A0ABM0K026_APLCA|nr:ATP-binding cassette sub-family A member 3 [Aplysia californica]